MEAHINDGLDPDETAWADNITRDEYGRYWHGENLSSCSCGGRAHIGGRIIDGLSYPTVHCGSCWVETKPTHSFARAKELWEGRKILTQAEMATNCSLEAE